MTDPMTETAADDATIEVLYVQTAHSMSAAEGRISLHRLAPSTLYFSDRPDRVTGHIRSSEFIETWDQGDDSFALTPPNAVLSVFQPTEVQDVVVVLTDPQLSGDALTYAVQVLDGELPASGGECALFIDTIGRPLSPVSIAGMNRRARRRR
ncbi:MAG TPA: hypothetical protein VFP05_16895 [Thermomicrobiales bacterium]|nr:hypothetical protein [Thermomicrobiales bacterium]